MKRRTLFFFLVTCLCLSQHSYSQPPCGFDILHARLMDSDPAFAGRQEQHEASIRKFIESHPALKTRSTARGNALYTIPVVVHVMHTGGAVGSIYNPSDAQIIGAINYLNQVYAGTFPGMTAPAPGGAAGDMEIEFALAQRTPSCGATNGIDRVDASSLPNYVTNGVNVNNTNGCPEITLKDFARWNPANYYNIWIVNRLDGADGTSGQFIAGFAYFPSSPANYDGTIMLATQMISGQKTLPHEIGHALDLYHPFQGSANSSQCPPLSPCATTGDRICDTDPISNNNVGGIYNFSCRTGTNTCTGTAYTSNTESNFMSYTNCYTLFTNDQKARVQAAMSLSSRSSLIDPSNLALTPCGTTVNFSQASATRTEDITGTLVGCRRYRDYNYQMGIGAGPSATAIATLSYSGTAIQGLDYDITTNGSFVSPSNTLSFAAGSTLPQSFTVRIYDDENVETPETIIVDFTLNNGGGDATKGAITPTFTLTIADDDQAPLGTSSGTFPVGTFVSSITGAPFDARQQSQRSQYIYRANELLAAGVAAGNLTAIQLNVNSKLSTRPFTNFTIKMGLTTLNYLYENPSVVAFSGLTTVFTTASYATAAGWNNFTLSTPFAWDGISNLAIEICFDNITSAPGDAADQVRTYLDGGTANQGSTIFQNGINCAGAFSTVNVYTSGRKPIIQLSNAVTGTTIETIAGSTSSSHIAAGSNDYFYSNNNRLMLRLGTISAPLSCVNVNLEQGGTSWINYRGGQRSAKVFEIIPTTNGSSTSYTLSLYFDNAELGGKTASTLKIAKTNAASIAASNGSNTVLVTPTVTTLGSGTTVFTANFTGFSRFFLVDPAVTLPVELVDFRGKLDSDKNTVLEWETAAEFNNHKFDVELSRDGSNFSILGSVNSKGNSNLTQQYTYTHLKPQLGINWYRLRQVDWDGHETFSKIISVSINKPIGKAFVYPVPASNTIMIDFGAQINNCEIEILAADMRLIKRESANGLLSRKEISISELTAGAYFVRLSHGSIREVISFIKK